MKPPTDRVFHDVLVEALEAASYSSAKLADDAGLDWSTLAKWKAGTRNPRAENAKEVGRALAAKGRQFLALAEELIEAAGSQED